MIEYSARYLSTSHSCIVWIPFDHTRFLMSMGQRSVPVLRRQIASPTVGMNSKIHLAWVLGRLGDYSQFQVFINGLNSTRQGHQCIAAARMRDFPQECLRHLPAVLSAGRRKRYDAYWNLLDMLAYRSGLPTAQQDALLDTLADLQFQPELTDADIQRLLVLFGQSGRQPSQGKLSYSKTSAVTAL